MGQYILYKGVFLFFFYFFRVKKLLYIHIYVCVNKKKKKNEKVISQCSKTALFRVKWSKIEFLFFFLMGRASKNPQTRVGRRGHAPAKPRYLRSPAFFLLR